MCYDELKLVCSLRMRRKHAGTAKFLLVSWAKPEAWHLGVRPAMRAKHSLPNHLQLDTWGFVNDIEESCESKRKNYKNQASRLISLSRKPAETQKTYRRIWARR